MTGLLARARRAAIGVSDREALAFSAGDSPTWAHLETVVTTAVGGYHAVLDSHRLDTLVPRLQRTPADLRGYAFEGAAMGLTGMDCFLPGPSRFAAFVRGPAAPHLYMSHIGAGEALARLRRSPEPFLRRLGDPVVRWLVMDGYGFHEGFFKPDRHVVQQRVPARLSPFAARVFDQGVGRSIWFRAGTEAAAVEAVIAAFPAGRQADLWLGVGVACGYVGGLNRTALEVTRRAAGPHAAQLAIGTAFVAKGRHRAGNPIPDTDLACDVLCAGLDSRGAAAVVDRAWLQLPDSAAVPAYAALQQRLAARFTAPAGFHAPAVAHMPDRTPDLRSLS